MSDFWEGYVPEPVKPRGEATLAQQEPVACFSVFRSISGERNTRFLELASLPDGEHYFYTSPPAQRTWEEWFKWWRTSKVADSTEAEIDFADFMLIVRAVEAEYGIKENT